MNVSKNSKKQGSKKFLNLKNKISVRLIIYALLITSIYFIQGLSVYGFWYNREKCAEHSKEWYTKTVNKYQVLNKLQEFDDSGSKNWLLLRNMKTKKVFKLDVTAETYMTKNSGDYVWFELSKSQEYSRQEIPESLTFLYNGLAWVSLFIYLTYLFILFDIDGNKKFNDELSSSKIKRFYLVSLPIFTTIFTLIHGFIFALIL
jgi:hypothetical protein